MVARKLCLASPVAILAVCPAALAAHRSGDYCGASSQHLSAYGHNVAVCLHKVSASRISSLDAELKLSCSDSTPPPTTVHLKRIKIQKNGQFQAAAQVGQGTFTIYGSLSGKTATGRMTFAGGPCTSGLVRWTARWR